MKTMNMTFHNEEIRLDFGEFENCDFESCKMVYGGFGSVSLNNCTFNDVQWEFVDAAQNTLHFMTEIYHGLGEGGQQLIEKTFDNIKRGVPPP